MTASWYYQNSIICILDDWKVMLSILRNRQLKKMYLIGFVRDGLQQFNHQYK